MLAGRTYLNTNKIEVILITRKSSQALPDRLYIEVQYYSVNVVALCHLAIARNIFFKYLMLLDDNHTRKLELLKKCNKKAPTIKITMPFVQ
jgi:hypothetical protein